MAEFIGYLLAFNAIITWSIASLVYKFGLGKTEAKASIFFRLVCISIATFIYSLIFSGFGFLSALSSEELISYLFWCLVSGLTVTIGDIMYFISLRKIDASRAFPLTQLSLVFVYPFAFIFFGEQITISILIGGTLILSSVFILSSKDKLDNDSDNEVNDEDSKNLIVGVSLGIGAALFWALSIVSFHQARIISNDVFVTNFLRIIFATVAIGILGIFQRDYYAGFKKENRKHLKYFFYIGLAGSLSLGFADSLFYKAAEINGLVLTSTITANTHLFQLIFPIIFLKEKFRKKFFIAVALIILGNYLILFL